MADKMANKSKIQQYKFTMEDHVYKGEVIPFSSDCKSFGELMWKSINKHKNRIAYVDAQTDKVVTFVELQNKVVKCALWLQQQGIKPDDIITICSGNHLDSIVPLLAATYINSIFNPWSENMDLHTAQHMLNLTMPKVIFCTKKPVDVILRAIKDNNCSPIVVVYGEHPATISFSDVLSGYGDEQIANFRYLELDDIKKTVCIMHSSGTTGMPKGVEISNYCLMMGAQIDMFQIANSHVTLWYSTLYWLTGVIMNTYSIMYGIKMIIYPHFDEEMTCRLVEKYKVDRLLLATSMINRFQQAEFVTKYSLSTLESIFVTGAMLKLKVQEKLTHILPQINLLQLYGMTETYAITVQYPCQKIGSCGIVLPNTEIKIVDLDSGKTLGPNQMGEICIKTATIMTGYYGNPEATKNTFDDEGWLHSGDIGYINEDGELYVSDRLKDLIKYRGFQISPGEIENLLHTHPGVMEAAVLGVPHPIDDEHPIAFVTTKSGITVTKEELINLVASDMSDIYKLRAGVVFLDSFPYTATGKIAKKDLRSMTKKLTVE